MRRYGDGIAGRECFGERFIEQPLVVPRDVGQRQLGRSDIDYSRRQTGSGVRRFFGHGTSPLGVKKGCSRNRVAWSAQAPVRRQLLTKSIAIAPGSR